MNQCSDVSTMTPSEEEGIIYIKQEPETDYMYYSEWSPHVYEHSKLREKYGNTSSENSTKPDHETEYTFNREWAEPEITIKQEPELMIKVSPSAGSGNVVNLVKKMCYYCGYVTFSLGRLRRHIVYDHMKYAQPPRKQPPPLHSSSKRSTDGETQTPLDDWWSIGGCPKLHGSSMGNSEWETLSPLDKHPTLHNSSGSSTGNTGGEKPFQCTVCSYRCGNSGHLNRHMLTHSGEKPTQCTICSYRCRESNTLKRHMLTHSGEKPFQCTVCSYRCRESGTLKRHMLIHSGEQPFQCTLCNYRCRQSCTLKKHMLIHSGEKPFQCTVCSFKCRDSGKLKRHMLIHSGEKPYQCTVCHYRCRDSSKLKRHMMVHP